MNAKMIIALLKKSTAALLAACLAFNPWTVREAAARVVKAQVNAGSGMHIAPVAVGMAPTLVGGAAAAVLSVGKGILPSVQTLGADVSAAPSVQALSLPAAVAKTEAAAAPQEKTRATVSRSIGAMNQEILAIPEVQKVSTGKAHGTGTSIENLLTGRMTRDSGGLVHTDQRPTLTADYFQPSVRLRSANLHASQTRARTIPLPTTLQQARSFVASKQGVLAIAALAAFSLIAMQLYMPAIITSLALMGLTGTLKDSGEKPSTPETPQPPAHAYDTSANAGLQKEVEEMSEVFTRLKTEIRRVIVGQEDMVDSIITAMIAGEHILLEGVPGVAKTRTVQAFADGTGADFQRIQGTSDKMPADILGAEVLQLQKDGTRSLVHEKGPIFARIVLFDEINRAMPKTQSALLEAMQERQVTIGNETYDLPSPFLLLATQNPIEQEGTFPLPEAQQDRFMYKIIVPQPSREERKKINALNRKKEKIKTQKAIELDELLRATEIAEKVHMDPSIEDYIQDIIDAVLEPHKFGIGQEGIIEQAMITRASIYMEKAARIHALMLGRSFVIPQDVRDVTPKLLRHRVKLSYAAGDRTTDQLLEEILKTLPTPKPAQ